MAQAHPVILAFDTSTPSCDAAVLRGSQILVHRSEPMQKGQAERILALCQDLLAEAGVKQHDLSALGVGIGPGNFTGIRISVSAARGLALGLNIPSVGVSTFQALHYGSEGPCACAVDARRGQIYLQNFDAAGVAQDPVLVDPDHEPTYQGTLIGQGGVAAQYPRAVAIAHVARINYPTSTMRPAPLYLRPADAAPARDAPPKILT